MKKILLLLITANVFALAFIALIVGLIFSYQEIDLRKKVEAQKDVREESFDRMWNTVSQKAHIAQDNKESFRGIYPLLIDGRYASGGGLLMKWIEKHNSTFDVSHYKDIEISVETERIRYFLAQKELLDLARKHQDLRTTFPSNIFVGRRDEMKILVLTPEWTMVKVDSTSSFSTLTLHAADL